MAHKAKDLSKKEARALLGRKGNTAKQNRLFRSVIGKKSTRKKRS